MGGEKLTRDEVLALRSAPLTGPEIGSNFWPMLCFDGPDGAPIDGEVVDGLARRGLLLTHPRSMALTLPANSDWEAPDVDCRYDYRLSPTGRAALKEAENA